MPTFGIYPHVELPLKTRFGVIEVESAGVVQDKPALPFCDGMESGGNDATSPRPEISFQEVPFAGKLVVFPSSK